MTERQTGGANAGSGNRLEHVHDVVGGNVYYSQASHELQALDAVLGKLTALETRLGDLERLLGGEVRANITRYQRLSFEVYDASRQVRRLSWFTPAIVLATVVVIEVLARL